MAVYTHFQAHGADESDRRAGEKQHPARSGRPAPARRALRDAGAHPRCAVRDGRCDDAGAERIHVGEEIEAILQRLIDRANGDLDKAQRGIVFIDEVDKAEGDQRPDARPSGEQVQHALLKIMEGSAVKLQRRLPRHDAGAVHLRRRLRRARRDHGRNHSFGFISTSEADSQKILDRLNVRVKPTDLNEFGLIRNSRRPSAGRARLNALTRDMLVRIMVEPQNSIYRQFREVLKGGGRTAHRAGGVRSRSPTWPSSTRPGAQPARHLRGDGDAGVYLVPDNPAVKKVVIPRCSRMRSSSARTGSGSASEERQVPAICRLPGR